MVHGISYVVCTYNGASRLQRVVGAILSQLKTKENYELILVDNNSTDGSAKIFNDVVAEHNGRVILEKQQGLMFARLAGLKASKYKNVLFVDDDNYIQGEWHEKMIGHITSMQQEYGAIGGFGKLLPVENQLLVKPWFYEVQRAVAVGRQGPSMDELSLVDRLYGACVCVNRDVLLRHLELGGEFFLLGRTDSDKLTSGDDSELCEILKLHGYSLYHDPTLVFSHDIPLDRLTESYFLRLFDSFGDAFVSLLPYKLLALPFDMGKLLIKCPALVRLVINVYWGRLLLPGNSRFYKKCQSMMYSRARYSLSDSIKIQKNAQVFEKLNELRVKLK